MSVFLQQVEIRDFRTFGKFVLDLPGGPGALVVTGPNGLGKSSFFDAIEWALTCDVKRLSPHAGRNDSEAIYLTRDGAQPFSHHVRLGFTEGEVTRTGSPNGPRGTAAQNIRSLLVQAHWPEQVSDLSTYLALTHFLGQGASQRFMAKESKEQWQTLRTPSGVDRLETIWKRLRGRSATIAINRRLQAATNQLHEREYRLAQWDARVQRLRRLEGVAAALGALPREEIHKGLAAIKEQLAQITGKAWVVEPPTLAEVLVILSENIAEALRTVEARETRLAGLEKLPDQYAEAHARLAAQSAQLAELRAQQHGSEEAIAARAAVVDALERDRRHLLDRAQRARERVGLLSSATSDLRDAAEASARRQSVEAAIAETELSVLSTRATLSEAERELEEWHAARDAVANAEVRLGAAQALALQAGRLPELERLRADADIERDQASAAAQAVDTIALAENLRLASVAEAVAQAMLAEHRERAGVLSATVAQLAAHLTDHDLTCPVCKTPFPEGELKRLADLSARETDVALPAAQGEVDLAVAGRLEAQAAVETGARIVAALSAAEASVQAANHNLDAERMALAARLGLANDGVDLVAEAEQLLAAATEDVTETRLALASLEASALEKQRRVGQAREEIDRLESRLRNQRAELARAAADVGAAESRFQVRLGEEGVEATGLPDLLARAQAEQEEAEAAAGSLDKTHAAEAPALAALRADGELLLGRLNERQRQTADLETQLSGLLEIWAGQALEGPPSHLVFETARGKLQQERAALQRLQADRRRLAEGLEATAGREEMESLRKVLVGEAGGASFEGHREALEDLVAQARSQEGRIDAAQTAIIRLAEGLQDEAKTYSSDVLSPLNKLIGAFNEALLTDPGTSVAFNTEYFADRTEFNAQLNQSGRAGADPLRRKIDPRLILSEGELAANGFSILCSASAYYPWSTWRALLLDDPLQHNDVIHAAAFTDLMRNLVEQEGYQVLMSSHDRAETEYIERKFSAARLPCTVVHLIADSPRGVTFEVRNNLAAREALQSQGLRAG